VIDVGTGATAAGSLTQMDIPKVYYFHMTLS
jgi:hypothetical protein